MCHDTRSFWRTITPWCATACAFCWRRSPTSVLSGMPQTDGEAVRLAPQLHPDVVVMDIAMPELNGIEATQQIHDASPSTQVLILSMHSTTEHIFRALQAGARGYLLKDSAGTEVVDAVRVVHAGRRYLSQKIASTVLDDYISERSRASPLDSLSPRERQILQLVAEGKSSAEAARDAVSVAEDGGYVSQPDDAEAGHWRLAQPGQVRDPARRHATRLSGMQQQCVLRLVPRTFEILDASIPPKCARKHCSRRQPPEMT